MSSHTNIPFLQNEVADTDTLIRTYFLQDITNLEILAFLALHHNILFSLSTLKRRLKRLGLRKRILEEDEDEIRAAIVEELGGSGKALGYRKMWKTIQQRGIPARRTSVMEILRELDPEGVAQRKKKRLRRRQYSVPGPDFMWHLDGYDKLKPFGFSIHGYIDGFSRRLLWLKVDSTNKKPEVIAKYFIDTAKGLKRIPTRMRSDDGSENSIVEAIQIALRSAHSDVYSGEKSFIVGTSTANQKIESFWSQLAKDRPSWWRNFFQELMDQGHLDSGNVLIQQCVRYSFMHLIRAELDEVLVRWNQHLLAKSKTSILPRGRPDSIYFLPEIYGATSHAKSEDIQELEMFDDPSFAISCDDTLADFNEFAHIVLEMKGEENLYPAKSLDDAEKLYCILLEAIKDNM